MEPEVLNDIAHAFTINRYAVFIITAFKLLALQDPKLFEARYCVEVI